MLQYYQVWRIKKEKSVLSASHVLDRKIYAMTLFSFYIVEDEVSHQKIELSIRSLIVDITVVMIEIYLKC